MLLNHRKEFPYQKLDHGKWSLKIPANADGTCRIKHGTKIKLVVLIKETGEMADRISPWAEYVAKTGDAACVLDWVFYNPEKRFQPKFDRPEKVKSMRIYEAHVGIASDKVKHFEVETIAKPTRCPVKFF